MGRPGLIGLAARTAVVAGTATAVSGAVQGSQQAKAQEQYDAQQYQASQQQAAMDAAAAQAVANQQAAQQASAQQAYLTQTAPPAASGGTDVVAELQKLAALQQSGVLAADEFAAAKAKLLS
jgi:hypothetical protein